VCVVSLAIQLLISGVGAAATPGESDSGRRAPRGSPPAADRVPEGLSAADWSSIRAVYEASRHAAFAVEDGYVARNPGQQWRTRFDGRGFVTTPDGGDWSWGLELVSYGRAGAEQGVRGLAPAKSRCGQRIEYDWSETLTEWYVNDQRGLEHGYTVHRRPDEAGMGGASGRSARLRFTLAVRGELRPRISGGGRDVTFVNDAGAALLSPCAETSCCALQSPPGVVVLFRCQQARYFCSQMFRNPAAPQRGGGAGPVLFQFSGRKVAPGGDASQIGVNGSKHFGSRSWSLD